MTSEQRALRFVAEREDYWAQRFHAAGITPDQLTVIQELLVEMIDEFMQ
jgi:hypothetical protein